MIELDQVTFSYGDSDLLDKVSLTLSPGSFHFLTGPSGSGKSTLIKLCYMDLAARAGLVSVFKSDVATLDRDVIAEHRRRIGVVHQDCQFLDHLSVRDNIALPLLVANRNVPQEEENLNALLSWVGLHAQQNQRPPELSGGERQRAALARAVIMGPDVILADEPTGNVDWEMSMRLLSLLIELNKMGKSILVATHDMALIRAAKKQVTARVLRIANHQLVQAGTDL